MLIRVALISGVLIVTALLAYVSNKLGLLIPFTLIVGLLVATAIIAPFADNLGKKLGKKRISWFGLRPRTTATIATIGSSWVIMFLTLTVLLVVVAPLRHALFRYESDKARLTQDVESAKTDLRTAKTDLKTAKQSVSELQTKADGLQANVVKYQDSALKSQAQAREYQTQALDFRGQAQKAQAGLFGARQSEREARLGEQSAKRGAQAALLTAKTAQAKAREALLQQQAAQKALEETKRSLETNQQRLVAAQGRLTAAQKRLQTAEQQVIAAEQRVAYAGRQVLLSGRQVVNSQREVVRAQQDAEQAKQEAEQARQEVANAKAQLIDLQKQADALSVAVLDYDQISSQLAYNEIRLPVQQILAERRIDASQSSTDIARELGFLVSKAGGVARSIMGDEKLEFAAKAFLVNRAGEQITYNEPQAIKFYSELLASANQTVSARLVSASNYTSAMTIVTAQFVFIPIKTIYIARQDIAEATIDINKSESAIFRQLQDLVDDARINAEKNGARPPVIPPIEVPGAPRPTTDTATYFFDGDTGPKMFEALRAVQKFDHPVKVRIVAARDLDSAEPLQIRFIVGDQN